MSTFKTNHPTYGEICYTESFWTSKRSISINDVNLVQQNKTTFLYSADGNTTQVKVKGGQLTQIKLTINDTEITLGQKPQWYEILCSIIIFAFVMAWGNSPALCRIVPIIGGAIGGAISGACAFVNLVVMKSTKNVLAKLGIWLAFFAGAVLLCYLVAQLFLSLI